MSRGDRTYNILFNINGEKIIYVYLIYSVICPLIFQDNNIAKLVYDLLYFVSAYFLFEDRNGNINKRCKGTARFQFFFFFMYIVTCTLSVIIFNSPLLKVWWNSRTSILIFIFWLLCIKYNEESSVERVKEATIKMSHFNFAFAVLELFLGYKQDQLGGIFGAYIGTNSILNAYMLIVSIIIIEKALVSKGYTRKAIIIILENSIIAAFAELKVYYIELILVFVILILFNKPSMKTLLILMTCGIVLYVGILILYSYYPYYASFFSIDRILESYEYAYASNGGLSRGRAFDYIEKTFLNNNISKLFGIGYGNATFSNIDFISSPFYKNYGYLKYNWFCHSYKFLETGWLGVISFMGFWLSPIINMTQIASKENRVIAKALSLMTLLLFVYNSSLMNLYIVFFLIYFTSLVYCNKKSV